jgi:hypothetical protein
VTWLKPKTCPSGLAREALAALPEAIGLREVRDHIGTPGVRSRQITLVTALLDEAVPRAFTTQSQGRGGAGPAAPCPAPGDLRGLRPRFVLYPHISL